MNKPAFCGCADETCPDTRLIKMGLNITIRPLCHYVNVSAHIKFSQKTQGQLLESVECHIYLYCFTFDDINLNRAFVIIVLFPKKYSNKKACANDVGKRNALGIY